MKILNFDFNHGRLDVSTHPFCGGVPRDVRMTTRYDERDWTESLMGTIHETGHGLYEQNLPQDFLDQPLAEGAGMSIHESQSLFFELQVGRSPSFLGFLAPMAQRIFDRGHDTAFTPDNLQRLWSQVTPSFIRVSADEVTYPCHVILRFELERALIEREIECEDLPGLWNEKMQQYLGLSTEGNDRDGVMQDVHWPSGAFGYFPSYTLGAMTAAQLARAVRKAIPAFDQYVRNGNLAPIQSELRERIWKWGSMYEPAQLVERATGEPLNPKYFLEHLKDRYRSK